MHELNFFAFDIESIGLSLDIFLGGKKSVLQMLEKESCQRRDCYQIANLGYDIGDLLGSPNNL